MGRKFTSTQAQLLAQLLDGASSGEAAENLKQSVQAVAQTMVRLRDHGLVVRKPSVKHRKKMVQARKDGSAVTWSDRHGPWEVYALPLARYERTDLAPVESVVVVKCPFGSWCRLFEIRPLLFVSYTGMYSDFLTGLSVDQERSLLPGELEVMVRVLTEMVAAALGLEAVLGPEFLSEGVGSGGSD